MALALGIPETSGVLREKPDKGRLLDEYASHRARMKPRPAGAPA